MHSSLPCLHAPVCLSRPVRLSFCFCMTADKVWHCLDCRANAYHSCCVLQPSAKHPEQDRRSTPAAALVTLRPPPATSGGRGFEEAQCRCQGQWDTAALCLAQLVPAGAGHVLPGPCRPASRTQARGENDHFGYIACLGNSAVQRHNCLQSKACFYACARSKCNLLRSAAACVICDALHTYASSVYNRSA